MSAPASSAGAAFDVCGPLPTGVTVLEASAGTGKTYTIAGLAARYVAEGLELDRLLAITFTRNATAELRDRVRERLVSAEQALERALAGVVPTDRVEALLADGTREEVGLRRDRLASAVASFDAATIVTTHGFCQEVLGGLGIAGDLEPKVQFVEDLRDLVGEVVDDLYVRAFHGREEVPFDRAQALAIARAADRNPGAPLEPRDAPPDTPPELRRRLAAAVRRELEVRKRRLGVMTYDDLLTRLDAALATRPEIADRLRAQFEVVLVDEFQDTDPIQWRIVQRAFGQGDTKLVLIGDPKQAIYAFRGADVYAYLEAASTRERLRLDENWRSDPELLAAYDALFGRAQLGHEGIVYQQVRAAHADRPVPPGTPLRVRVVRRDDVGTTGRGFAMVQPAREHIARDVAADVVRQLSSGACRPGDVAVLVRRNVDAELVQAALADVAVPAVLNGAGSVFDTRAADEWLRLLEALERPTSAARVHAAALTAFLGWSAAKVAGATGSEWEDVHARLHRWAGTLRKRGVAAMTEAIMLVEQVPPRVLASADGERRLTDLRHIGELLHAAAMEQGLGVTALTTWLRHRIKLAREEMGDEERSRRLESDAAAVQILTIHRSKGLEFPIVYVPFAWDPSPVSRAGEPLTFHDGAVRKVDVGLQGRQYLDHLRRSVSEQRGEDLRLLYVALTRARHQAVVWWAGSERSKFSPLGRLVFFQEADGSVAESGGHVPADAAAFERFSEIAAAAPGCMDVDWAAAGASPRWRGETGDASSLAAATFDRELDSFWRRTSYSALTAGSHDSPRVASEPEERVVDDEPEVSAASPAAVPARPSLLADMPAGVRVGTFVHDVFEAADFAAADLDAELRSHVAHFQARRHVDIGDPGAVVAGLRAAIETPFAGGQRLRDLGRGDRLDELVFELPLVGGDQARGELTLPAIASALRDHLPPGDPLAGYPDRLGDPALAQTVQGYLTGSIDLVLRTRGGRFAVVDYKTNWLGAPDEPLTLADYRPPALVAAMQSSHYVLQGLLYTVALHRYLRWRLPSYSAAEHLAGMHYLFLRGMDGSGDAGVFSWTPPEPLVLAVDAVLEGG
jgi:exodeoxyribonuclease V beta subunit